MIILEEIKTDFGKITITESKKTGFRSYCQDECLHSEAQVSGTSTCAYIHVMYHAIRQINAKNILVIGCAAGSLPTMLDRVGCDVDVVDINPCAFSIARKYFEMPKSVTCYLMDGFKFLQKSLKEYDAIAVDAFDSDGTIPEQFRSLEFFNLVKTRLCENGIVVMNTLVESDEDKTPDDVEDAMSKANMPVILFDWPMLTHRNIIIAAGNVTNIQPVENTGIKSVRDDLRGVTLLKG